MRTHDLFILSGISSFGPRPGGEYTPNQLASEPRRRRPKQGSLRPPFLVCGLSTMNQEEAADLASQRSAVLVRAVVKSRGPWATGLAAFPGRDLEEPQLRKAEVALPSYSWAGLKSAPTNDPSPALLRRAPSPLGEGCGESLDPSPGPRGSTASPGRPLPWEEGTRVRGWSGWARQAVPLHTRTRGLAQIRAVCESAIFPTTPVAPCPLSVSIAVHSRRSVNLTWPFCRVYPRLIVPLG